jgi:hypothetical protein
MTMKNSIRHPISDTDIYFMRDVPHLFKCIRNRIFNYGDTDTQLYYVNLL